MEHHRDTAPPSSLAYPKQVSNATTLPTAQRSHHRVAPRTNAHTHIAAPSTSTLDSRSLLASTQPRCTPEPLHAVRPSLAGLTILAAPCAGRCRATVNTTASPWTLAYSRSTATVFTTRVVL